MVAGYLAFTHVPSGAMILMGLQLPSLKEMSGSTDMRMGMYVQAWFTASGVLMKAANLSLPVQSTIISSP